MKDYNKIIDEIIGKEPQIDDEYAFAQECMKEAIKQAIPLILQKIADNSYIQVDFADKSESLILQKHTCHDRWISVNKQSILDLQTELEKELL